MFPFLLAGHDLVQLDAGSAVGFFAPKSQPRSNFDHRRGVARRRIPDRIHLDQCAVEHHLGTAAIHADVEVRHLRAIGSKHRLWQPWPWRDHTAALDVEFATAVDAHQRKRARACNELDIIALQVDFSVPIVF